MDVKYKIGMFSAGSTIIGIGQQLLQGNSKWHFIAGIVLIIVGAAMTGGAVYLMFKQEAERIVKESK